MNKKILIIACLAIMTTIFSGYSLLGLDENEEITKNENGTERNLEVINQQNNIELTNIHEVQNYRLEECQDVGVKKEKDGLSCECVEYSQLGNIWTCNNKVIVGNSYMSLDTFRENRCSIALMEMPGCGLVDGEIKCGEFNCKKETLVFSEVSQISEQVEPYINISPELSNSISFDSVFWTTRCEHNYSYQRNGNHLKIIKNLIYESCFDMAQYSKIRASIINLPKGKYKISMCNRYDKYKNINEILTENFEIK